MSHPFHGPDRPPTPAELSAWADGELLGPAARRVETWLATRPDAAAEVEQVRGLTRLYRDHPAPEPAPAAWRAALGRIEDRLSRPAVAPSRPPGRPWRWPLLLGLVSAAALFGGVVIARALWPAAEAPVDPTVVAQHGHAPAPAPPPAPEDDEVFPVASAREVDILSIDPRDADRVVLGDPLLGTFEWASPEDIEVLDREPDPEDGHMPRLQRGPNAKVPLVIVTLEEERP